MGTLKHKFFVFFFVAVAASFYYFKPDASRHVAEEESIENHSGFQIWSDLIHDGTTLGSRALYVPGTEANEGKITLGAEKEASSSLITRVMSPKSEVFKRLVDGLPDNKKEEFLREFLTKYKKNSKGFRTYKDPDTGQKVDLARDVKNIEGESITIDMSRIQALNTETASLSELDEVFNHWLDQTQDSPFSFIKPTARRAIFNGKVSGVSKQDFDSAKTYRSWVPVFGDAQKYISDAHNTSAAGSKGWEINFNPMGNYGDFERMVFWFKKNLENRGKMFQSPGHQRIVFPIKEDLPKAKLGELFKMIQAYIVAEGIRGKTGIEVARHKSIHKDESFAGDRVGRGVIRLDGNRWGDGTQGVEFRAGTKDARVQRFTQMVLMSRIAANEFDDLNELGSYTLVKDPPINNLDTNPELGVMSKRFKVKKARIKTAMELVKELSSIYPHGVKANSLIAFWDWYDKANPIVPESKKKLLRKLTKDFILELEKIAKSNASEEVKKKMVREANTAWVRSSKIYDDIRKYMAPKTTKFIENNKFHEFKMAEGARVDVNKVDLGIEYSAKMPLRLYAEYSDEKLADNKKHWLRSMSDLTPEERIETLKNIARDLGKNLGVSSPRVTKVQDSNDHGHGLDIAYEVKDSKGRTWRVEWDGIGRTYDDSGNVVDGSVRGGSVELVTPKFVPTLEEIDSVYKAFQNNGAIPHIKAGGGHINVDLAAFADNPKAFARFLSIFHEYRSVIALMFQYPSRMKAAEAIEISPTLSRALKNFEGTEDELKALLYNERYFNTRAGRKTRYNQLDVSAYYQDIIPEQFISEDYDIGNPNELWREQFRVDPKIRKAEFRLFDAPKDAYESSIQIKLVRAMLNKALNDDSALSGNVQNVSHEEYLKDTKKATSDLEKMANDLGLDINEYRPMLYQGLGETDFYTKSAFYEPLSKKLSIHPKTNNWGQAVAPRSEAQAISSEGRAWSGDNVSSEAERLRDTRQRANSLGADMRARNASRPVPFQRDCITLLQSFLAN